MIKRFSLVFLLVIIFQISPNLPKVNFDSPYNSDSISVSNSSIAIIGDIQKTSIWEYFMGREENDEERIHLINKIAEVNPAALIFLGDMVFDGSDEEMWKDFDSLVKPVLSNNIPVLPVLGNHEYWGNNLTALRNVKNRFNAFQNVSWYSKKFNGLGMVFLNSNLNDLSEEEFLQQYDWYEKTLKEFDSDPEIKGTILFMHHPPFTNSTVTSDEIEVQKAFLPLFNQSKKTLALITGHAHTYERFIKEGKTFIVSGGGGGPRVDLKSDEDCHKDLCTVEGIRPFHFLLLNSNASGVSFTVKALDKGSKDFYELENFHLAFAR